MREKLTIAYPAIIDTGAYVSLIPKEIWSKSEINILLKSHYVKGLIPKEECKMEVKVGEICCHLVDEERITGEYRFMAYFADTNYIPIILGFRELLSKFKIYRLSNKRSVVRREMIEALAHDLGKVSRVRFGNHVAASAGLLRKAGFSDERIFGYYFCNLLAE